MIKLRPGLINTPRFLLGPLSRAAGLRRESGGAMIGAIVAILVVGFLGAGVVSLISTSSLQEVRANHGERAFYLAESGYRYAISVYRHAESGNKTQALQGLNGTTVTPDGGGWFTLKNIRIQGEDEPLIFTVDGNQTIAGGDNELAIEPYSQPEQYNNAFAIEGRQYRYLEYDEEGNTLKNIKALSPDASLPVTFTDGDNATAIPSVTLISRGEFPGSGFFNAVREVTYWQPLYTGGGGGGGPSFDDGPTLADDGDSMDDWGEGPGEPGEGDPLGDYESEEIDGNDALHLEDMNPGHGGDAGGHGHGGGHGNGHGSGGDEDNEDDDDDDDSGGGVQPYTSLMYQPEDGSRIEAGDYEVQVKIKLGDEEEEELPDHYMAGITFRKQNDLHNPGNLQSYGVSFIRGERGEERGPPSERGLIPNELLPVENTPVVVLWRMDGNPNSNDPVTRLAWASLESTTIMDENGILRDWSTLLVRVEEMGGVGSGYNQITAFYGDQAQYSLHSDADPMNQTRKSSLRLPDDSDYDLPWPPDNIDAWSPEIDFFTIVEWNTQTGDQATRSTTVINDQERGIRIHTAPQENLFTGGNLEVGLHTWGTNLEDRVWFDDFAVREAVPGDDDDVPFVPPIQK